MSDADYDRRLTRIEAKHEALETYLPALLDSIQRSQERVENSIRFTKAERLALVVGVFAIAATLAANLFV